MCYIIITGGSLVWFVLSLIADMLVATAIVTPNWLLGPNLRAQTDISAMSLPMPVPVQRNEDKEQQLAPPLLLTPRIPSVGINTRCKVMQAQSQGFHCGRFDLDGFATDSHVYPNEWKATMFFISLGFAIQTLTVALTLVTCCRQSLLGKSLHNITACAQVIAGINVMLALFLHPLGWGAERVQALCGPDAEPFYPASCTIGTSFYCAVCGTLLAFVCAGISLKAESSNMRTRVKRRVEEGDRLVCIP